LWSQRPSAFSNSILPSGPIGGRCRVGMRTNRRSCLLYLWASIFTKAGAPGQGAKPKTRRTAGSQL
jgi:hypothetical protein